MEKKISKPKKKGWGAEFVQIIGFQVTSSASIREDCMCPSQKLFLWSFVMTLKPLYATRKPKKETSHCLDKINYTVCTARQDDTERRRQLSALWDSSPTFVPPNSGVFKKRLWDAGSKSEQKIVTFGFSVLSQFSLIVNRKMSQFGELRQKEKKKTQNETAGLGWFYSFVQAFQWIQSVACLTRWHPSCDWVLRCSFVGFNRSVCQSRAVKYHLRSCRLPTDICPISVTS